MTDVDVNAAEGIREPVDMADLDVWIEELVERTDTTGLVVTPFAYGHHSEQVVDLWQPAGASPSQVIVLIHGGGFAAHFDRHHVEPIAVDLCRRGYAVWNIEYRRTDLGGGPATTIADVAAAIDHLAEATSFTGPFTVVGHSAGGFLALGSATHPRVSRVLAMGAVCDLRVNARERDDMYGRFVGGLPADVPEEYDRLDLTAPPAGSTEWILVCGLQDQPHRVEENRTFVDALRLQGQATLYEELAACGHFGFLDPHGAPWRRSAAHLRSDER